MHFFGQSPNLSSLMAPRSVLRFSDKKYRVALPFDLPRTAKRFLKRNNFLIRAVTHTATDLPSDHETKMKLPPFCIMSHSPSHYANVQTVTEFVEKSIVPFINSQRLERIASGESTAEQDSRQHLVLAKPSGFGSSFHLVPVFGTVSFLP